MTMRLNVFISKSGYCSRRKAEELIKNGMVTVDGNTINEPFHAITSDSIVCVNKQKIRLKNNVYIILNKPKNVTSTCNDKFAEKCVIDLFPENLKGIFPVGRLDKNSCGLIILTNDGQLCFQTTHPKFRVEKEYEVVLDRILQKESLDEALAGVKDAGEILKVEKVIPDKNHTKSAYRVIISEGKKRHLRRLFKTLGYQVIDLKRIRIGNVRLGNLQPGKHKFIKKEKIYHLLFSNPKLK